MSAMEIDEFDAPEGGVVTKLRPRNEGESLKKSEAVLRKRNRDLQGAAERATKIMMQKRAAAQERRPQLTTPAKLVKNFKNKQLDRLRLRREEKRMHKKVDDSKQKVLLAVRNGRTGGSADTARALKALGLTRKNTAVLLPNTEASMAALRAVEPFVFFGAPTLHTVRSLFAKRADIRENGKRVALTDNALVEDRMGTLGMLCVEDIVDHIWSGGDKFQEILAHFWPFKLSDLKKAEGLAARKFEFGNMKAAINDKLAKILG